MTPAVSTAHTPRPLKVHPAGYPKRSFNDRWWSVGRPLGRGADERSPIDEPAQKFLMSYSLEQTPRTDTRSAPRGMLESSDGVPVSEECFNYRRPGSFLRSSSGFGIPITAHIKGLFSVPIHQPCVVSFGSLGNSLMILNKKRSTNGYTRVLRGC